MEKKQEEILYELQPSQVVFLGGYILCALVFFLIIPIFILLYNYLIIKTTKYIISTQRIRLRYGIINKITDEIELYRILDYKVREPFWMRIFGLANIELTTMDQSHPIFVLSGIRDAEKIITQIREYSEVAKSTSRVSEIDIGR
ncbi:MAG: Unknown protein [uncultured Campylobacterales bacterium]|uniref:YdbS-like PH domain-containing protein n=1 Tax=uncultured Campylobacterales bacterium TaxID=352960 RepID=A0A6S6SQD2_9BACT|nr:MAG: Unknown protein [uncultured Campylobacterales bacterium]